MTSGTPLVVVAATVAAAATMAAPADGLPRNTFRDWVRACPNASSGP